MKKRMCLITALLLLVPLCLSACGAPAPAELPRLYFEGDISEMKDKTDIRDIQVEYTDGHQTFHAYATVKLQGNSSLSYDKKNYTLKLYKDALHTEKLKVDMGWGNEYEYCLKANWVDKTLSRNIISANIVTQVQSKYGVLENAPTNGAIDGFPIEIYINGEFLGLYTFNIPKDKWLFAMDSDNPDHIVVCGEEWTDSTKFFALPDFKSWSVEVGPEDEATLEKLSALFDFVINSSDEEFIRDFETHMDLDAALHYYILGDFIYLTDNMGKNMLLATYDGQKWYPLLYDMDSSWGSRSHGRDQTPYRENGLSLTGNNLFARLETCFRQELSERYFELREDILTKENIMSQFEAFRDQIPQDAFDREAERWGEDRPGYDYAQIEEFLDIVIPRLDEKYAAMAEN